MNSAISLTDEDQADLDQGGFSMQALELRSVGKENISSCTATSAVNHILKDAVNTPGGVLPKTQPQVALPNKKKVITHSTTRETLTRSRHSKNSQIDSFFFIFSVVVHGRFVIFWLIPFAHET